MAPESENIFFDPIDLIAYPIVLIFIHSVSTNLVLPLVTNLIEKAEIYLK